MEFCQLSYKGPWILPGQILKFDHSPESCWAVHSCGVVYCAFQCYLFIVSCATGSSSYVKGKKQSWFTFKSFSHLVLTGPWTNFWNKGNCSSQQFLRIFYFLFSVKCKSIKFNVTGSYYYECHLLFGYGNCYRLRAVYFSTQWWLSKKRQAHMKVACRVGSCCSVEWHLSTHVLWIHAACDFHTHLCVLLTQLFLNRERDCHGLQLLINYLCQGKGDRASLQQISLAERELALFNPLSPYIHIQILLTYRQTILQSIGRIC